MQARKTWGCLNKRAMKNLLVEPSQTDKSLELRNPVQHSMRLPESGMAIKPFESSSATQISCRSSATVTVRSDTKILQTKPETKHRLSDKESIPDQDIPVLRRHWLGQGMGRHSNSPPRDGSTRRKTGFEKSDFIPIISLSKKMNTPSHREWVGDGRDSRDIDMATHETRHNRDKLSRNKNFAQNSTAEYLKAQILGNNGMETCENFLSCEDIITLKKAEMPVKVKPQKVKRNISATCFKTSEEIFEKRLHIKSSKSQQIVKPKTVKLHEEILYLLRDVPLQPSKDPKERMMRREVLKKLFRKLRHLTHKMEMTESDEDLLRNIRSCLTSVLDCERCSGNKHWDCNKCDKYNVTQCQVRIRKAPTQESVILKIVITHWFKSIELKIITSQQKERFLKDIISVLQFQYENRPRNDAEFREIIEGDIIDFLRELPILTDPECRRNVIIHHLTTLLVDEIMALTKFKQENNIPVSLRPKNIELKVFKDALPSGCAYNSMDSVIQPIEKELRSIVTKEISSFLLQNKLINDVFDNIEKDVAEILMDSIDFIRLGRENYVKKELLQFLKGTKYFSGNHAEELTENLVGSLKQNLCVADTYVEKDTGASGLSTATYLLRNKSRHNLLREKRDRNMHRIDSDHHDSSRHYTRKNAFEHTRSNIPSTSNNYTNTTVDSIQDITDQEIRKNFTNYTTKLIHQIENWLTRLEVQVPLAHNDSFRVVVVTDLAHDIADRQKYLQLNPSRRSKVADEAEYLKFQIFKWMNKLVGENNNQATLAHTSHLMNKIRNIPVPLLTKSSDFKRKQLGIANETQNATENQSKTSGTLTCTSTIDRTSSDADEIFDNYEHMVEVQINAWLNELPQEIKETTIFTAEMASLLAKDIRKAVGKLPVISRDTMCSVIDEKIPQWFKTCIQSNQKIPFSLHHSIERLKEKILSINVPVFVEKDQVTSRKKKLELCCKNVYEYPKSYRILRKILDTWSKRVDFLPGCKRDLLAEQLDCFAHKLQEITTANGKSYCEISRLVKQEISRALYDLPLPPHSNYIQIRTDLIDELWNHVKQDKITARPTGQLTIAETLKESDVKIQHCYQCDSVSSSQISSLQTRNQRCSETTHDTSNRAIEDKRVYTVNEKKSFWKKAFGKSKTEGQRQNKTLQEPSCQKPNDCRRRNTIDGILQKEPNSCSIKSSETSKKDMKRLNQTMQEPSNRILEEGRRHSTGGTCKQNTEIQRKTVMKEDSCCSNANKLTPDKINDNLEKFLTDWCQRVPVEQVDEEHISSVRKGLFNGIGKQIIKIRSDPLAVRDRFLTEDMLEGELDSLLECLPQTPNLRSKRLALKYELMSYVADTNQQLYEVCSSQSYRQKLKESLDKSLPKPKQTSAELEILQEIVKENMIDDFLQANYAGFDQHKRMAFHRKITQELERMARAFSQKGQSEPVNMEELKKEAYDAMYKVPVPTDETLLEQVKESIVKNEIAEWYNNLPISHAHGEEELYNNTNKSLLAKKIMEMEKQSDRSDDSLERNVKHEISKFINKFRLFPGEDLNINYMVDELTNRMKNSGALKDPNLKLPITQNCQNETLFPELRHYHDEFSVYKPLSSTLDPEKHPDTRFPLSCTRNPSQQPQDMVPPRGHPGNISAIHHDTPLDNTVNSRAPQGRSLIQREYQQQFNRSPRQLWKNAYSSVKQQYTPADDSKQWFSLQELNESGLEEVRQMKLQEEELMRNQNNERTRMNDPSYSSQQQSLQHRLDSDRRVLGTSQMPGPSCCDRSMKASDVLFKSVMEWCHQIPFRPNYPDHEKQALRAEVATKLMSKVGELNLDPNVLQDDFLYEGMLNSVVDHIMHALPQTVELENVKGILKDEIIRRLKLARKLALIEMRVHSYRKEINDTIAKVTQSTGKTHEQSIIDSAAKEKIADTLIEIKYKEKDRKKCKKKLIHALETYKANKAISKVQDKLADALVDIPTPEKEALAEEVEEVKLKNALNVWYNTLPLEEFPSSPEELEKTSKLISLLAKEIHELEKESSTVDNNLDLLKNEISHWVKRLPVKPTQNCKVNKLIEELAMMLKNTEPERRFTKRTHEQCQSSCTSFRASQSMPQVGSNAKSTIEPVSSQSVNLGDKFSQNANQSYSRTLPIGGFLPRYPTGPSLYTQQQTRNLEGHQPYNQAQNMPLGQKQTTQENQPQNPATERYFQGQTTGQRQWKNMAPHFCYSPPNYRIPEPCDQMGGRYDPADQQPRVCYRHYSAKRPPDSETPTDEENLNLYCRCGSQMPLCQRRKTPFFFTPPCYLYEDFKPPDCMKCFTKH